jgi:hypothetical protein
MNLKRDLYWILSALFFGVLVLPFFVYYTGVSALGPYVNGGPFDFLGDFLRDLGRARGAAWTLALGPAAITLVWRVLVRIFLPRRSQQVPQDSTV